MGIEVNGERIDTIKFDDDKTNLKRTEQVVQKLLNKKKNKKKNIFFSRRSCP